MRFSRALLLIMLAGVLGYSAGCGCIPHHARPAWKTATVDMVCLCDSLEGSVEDWRAEIARRYPGAVGVVCHGGDYGRWVLVPDHMVDLSGFPFLPAPVPVYVHDEPIPVEKEIEIVQHKYPGRMIVLISCNPGHYRLNIPNVAYSLESVWTEPDRTFTPRVDDHPEFSGNIFEFVTDD